MPSCRKIMTSLLFFGFLANLEHSKGRIPDTESAKVMFSGKVTFFLTKTENRTNTALTLLLWVKVYFWTKNAIFLLKNADISKIKDIKALKVYFLKLHMGMYLRAKFEASSIILTSFRQGWLILALKRTPKKPTQIRVKKDCSWIRITDRLWYVIDRCKWG